MTIKKKKSSRGRAGSSSQQSLFDVLDRMAEATRQADDPAPGSLDCDAEIKAALTNDLGNARDGQGHPLSRAQVAASMTDLVGSEITLTTLNNMTAASHAHRFPVSWLPALVSATGQRRALEVISRRTGLFILPGPDAVRAELDRLNEQKNSIAAEIKKRRMFLNEMKGQDG